MLPHLFYYLIFLQKPKPIDMSKIDMSNPDNIMKMSKSGKPTMMFVSVSGNPTEKVHLPE